MEGEATTIVVGVSREREKKMRIHFFSSIKLPLTIIFDRSIKFRFFKTIGKFPFYLFIYIFFFAIFVMS